MPARYRILTVCTGNICRSPMAEIVLRDRFASAGLDDAVEVASRGTSAEELGHPIDRRARQILAERGYPIPGRQAQQVTETDLAESQLVLAMTGWHARSVRELARNDEELTARVRLYRSFDPFLAGADSADLDIEDPWYGGRADFLICLDQIEAAADAIVEYVRHQLGNRPTGP